MASRPCPHRMWFRPCNTARHTAGDGGTTLARALGHIINECAGDALQIKAFIRVERTVFGRHNRVADVVRQPLARDDFTILLRVGADRGGAVRVIHGGFLGQRELFGLRDLGGGVQVCEYCDTGQQAQSNQGEEDAQHPFQYTVFAFSCVLFLPVRGSMAIGSLVACVAGTALLGRIGPSCAEWPALLCAVRGCLRAGPLPPECARRV